MTVLIVLPTPSLHIKMVTYYTSYTNNTERSGYVWTGVTGISLWSTDALAAGFGQRRIAVIPPHTFP